jgi:pSer/pThr/pTyr-binding forkhead associated (FHA) protein
VTLALRCTRGALAGTLIEVEGELVFGRGLPGQSGLGGDPKLSRRHARVYVEAGSLMLEDLGSTNGTWVNDQRLAAPRPLGAGDRVRCGDSSFEVIAAGSDPTRPADAAAPRTASPPSPVAPPPPPPAQPQYQPPPPPPAQPQYQPPPPPPAQPQYQPPPPPPPAQPQYQPPPPPPQPQYQPPLPPPPPAQPQYQPPPPAQPQYQPPPPPPPPPAPPTQPQYQPPPQPAPAAMPAGTAFLQVVDGPLAGQSIQIGAALGIGRGYGEPGALGGDHLLSRRHARIAMGASGVYFIQDTGSTNGTVLNGAPLRHAQPLGDGDEIRVGTTTLIARGLPRAPMAPEFEDYATPVPVAATRAGAPPALAGFGPPPVAAMAAPSFAPQGAAGTRLGSRRLIMAFVGAFVVSVAVGIAAVVLASPPGSRACPNGFVCQKPSKSPPLRSVHTFRGALGWDVEFDPTQLTASKASASGNDLVLHESNHQDKLWGLPAGSDLIAIEVKAFPAKKTSPKAAMSSMASSLSSQLVGATKAPNADQMFNVPLLGFHPGVGEVLEGDAKTPQGPGGLLKVAALAAQSGKLTVVAGVIYSVQRASNQRNDPDGPLDQMADTVLETVRFPSDGGQ